MSSGTRQRRDDMVRQIFPAGIPRLWCPPVTHYRADGSLDRERILAHVASLAQHVGGLLVPGSTGDGWDLSRDQKLELLGIVSPLAARLGLPVLVGALERTTDDMLSFIEAVASGVGTAPLVGIVVCAPSGAGLSEADIEASFDRVLGLGLPTAVYQLPQVTGNEISAATVSRLAARHPGLFMLKDSSGGDKVATAGLDLDGMFLVRGAEMGYRTWLKPGGPYDGFLLSTANWLAPQLAAIAAGTGTEGLDRQVDAAVAGAFELVPGYPTGNAFGNSAKLMDHVMAFGAEATREPGPYSRGGKPFPRELVERAVGLARAKGILPANGYANDPVADKAAKPYI